MSTKPEAFDVESGKTEGRERISVGWLCLWFGFALVPWIVINAIWSELAFFATTQPERYNVGSRLTLSIQCANILPIAYTWLKSAGRGPNLLTANIGVLSLALACAVFMSIVSMGDDSMPGWGQPFDGFGISGGFSWLLCLMTFLGGMVGCVSLVVLFPLVYQYGSNAVVVVASTAMSFCGLVPSCLALLQNAGPDAHFSLKVYFWIISGIIVCSCVCFFFIVRSPRSDHVFRGSHSKQQPQSSQVVEGEPDSPMDTTMSLPREQFRGGADRFWCLLVRHSSPLLAIAFVNFMQFTLQGPAFPAISFFLDPATGVTDVPISRYQTNFPMILQTIGAMLSMSKRLRTKRLHRINFVAFLFFVSTLVMCFENDTSFHHNRANAVLVIGMWSVYNFIYGFAVTNIFQNVGSLGADEHGEEVMRMTGLFNQLGALCGGLLGFAFTESGAIPSFSGF